MGYLLLAPVLVVAVISVLAALRRTPTPPGTVPEALRTVVDWRDPPLLAADIAGDAQEQLRQIVNVLAEHQFIFSSTIDRSRSDGGPVAVVDVRELRYELRARTHRGGRWLLWVDEGGHAPEDSDDLRQLLSGLYRTLEDRKGEGTRWHKREELQRASSPGAPSPFYVA